MSKDSQSISLATDPILPGLAPKVAFTPGEKIGNVSVIRELGRGGMGVVYLGYDNVVRRNVALKVLVDWSGRSDADAVKRLLDEARIAAASEAPGLTRILYADVIAGIPYFAMEYVAGPSLSSILSRFGALAPGLAFFLVKEIAEAVANLHDRNMVHRDIKPGNVLIDGNGHPHLTDFGLTIHQAQSRSTTETLAGGTPAYMAPEAFEGRISPRSDVYSLGILAYHLLSGSPPFMGSAYSLRQQHAEVPLPLDPLRSLNLSERLIDVIERACHKNPLYRYKSAREMLRALKTCMLSDDGPNAANDISMMAIRVPDAALGEEIEKPPAAPSSSTLAAVAQHKRATRPSQPPKPAAHAVGQRPNERGDDLLVDIPCIDCGQNLRGCSPRDQCTECGTPIQRSLRPDRIIFADITYLKGLRDGLRLLLVGGMTTIIFAGAVEFVIGARPRHSVEDLIGAIPPLWLAIWYFAGGILVTRLPTPGGTAPPPNHLRHLMVGFSLLATLTSLLMILSAGLIFLPYLCLTLAAPGAFVRIAGFMQRLPRPVLAPYFQMAFLFPSLSIATPVLISVFNPSPEFLIASIGALAIIAAVLLIASLFSGESHATAKRLSLLAILAVFLTLMITASWLFKTSAQEERTMILATHVLFAVWTIPFFLVAYFAVAASVRKHIPRSVFNPYSYPLSDS